MIFVSVLINLKILLTMGKAISSEGHEQ